MGNTQKLNISWLINFFQDDHIILLKFYKFMVGLNCNSHLCYKVPLGDFFFKLKAEIAAFG